MPKWINIKNEPVYYQPHQDRFLNSRRERICSSCKIEYSVTPEKWVCPQCGQKGVRKYDRLTIIAGRRFGKSRFGSIAGVEEACIPGSIGWACAPTNPKLHRYVIPAFQQLIPEDWVESWSTEFNDLRLKNGSLIHFQTLEDPDQGRGQGLDWLWIDEVCELTRKHWEVIRPSLAGPGVAFFTTTPRGFDWVYEELYLPAEQQVEGYWACHAPSSQSANPRLSADFLARERAGMSDTMYRQEYEADFVTFTGAVYGDLLLPQIKSDDQIRKILPEWPNIESWRQVLVGVDAGADHPFGAIKLVSTEFGLVAVDEYLERNKPWIQHAGALQRMAASANPRWGINKNDRQGMIELAQYGIYCQPAENDIVAGTERVKSWMFNDQLYISESRCPNTIKQLKAYRWAENISPKDESTRKEKVYKKDEDLCDALRYALMTWPQLPKAKITGALERDISLLPSDMQDVIKRMRRIEKEPKEPDSVVGDFWL